MHLFFITFVWWLNLLSYKYFLYLCLNEKKSVFAFSFGISEVGE
jgi:hypothetical protein